MGAPGARRNFLDEAEKAEILRLWDSGMKGVDIAERVGSSPSNVYLITKKSGRERPHRKVHRTRHSPRLAAARNGLGG